MSQIGAFHRTADGFQGKLWTLGLFLELALVPASPSDAEDAPAWRVHLGGDGDGPEIGAGWDRTGEKASAYIALQIDGPTLPQPIRANLFQPHGEGGDHPLIWTRPRRSDRS